MEPHANGNADSNGHPATSAPDMLEIDTGRKRRWLGAAAYFLFFFAVAVVLFVLLFQFTASWALAWGLVVFMVGYMAIMGWLGSRNAHRRNE